MLAELGDLSKGYPPATRGRLVVWGVLAACPFGGITWQALHHIAGLRRLGFDVWYVEDSDNDDIYDVETWWRTSDYERNVAYLARHMEALGLSDRWVFRPPNGSDPCIGALDAAGLAQLYRDADAVFNISGYNRVRPDHADIRCLVYLETDPLAVQVGVAKGKEWDIERCASHHVRFTYAENLGSEDCLIPVERFSWHTTRPPVCTDWWESPIEPTHRHLTTVVNWDTSGWDIEWQGRTFRWRKDHQFRAYRELPSRASLPLELAAAHMKEPEQAAMRDHGWIISSAMELSDSASYRDFLRSSLGEFSVVKEFYTAPRSGWFSDRSVCYLAAGRPVIMQSTGFEKHIPTGEGLFAFDSPDGALAAIDAVRTDHARHAKAASEIAREHFAGEVVLERVIDALA